MEGLIPCIVKALKRQKSQRSSLSPSESWSRSYYRPLNSKGSSDGSSHRRTRSDFQPPVAELLENRSSDVQFLHSGSLKTDSFLIPSNLKAPRKMDSDTYQASKEIAFSHLRRRNFLKEFGCGGYYIIPRRGSVFKLQTLNFKRKVKKVITWGLHVFENLGLSHGTLDKV
ncbi:hypothetical protein NE237_018358 [Protea cynaroides]|uniref:Uncharacterized protein n=1 Tax=Protea cynaroides TaxID=273540 RepID=A0A9Q0QP36_9MAGN|nr:hypothetical protein NE237_018358 [Protea cynaroides]